MSFNACGCQTPWIAPSIADTCSGSQYVAFMAIIDLIIRYACPISDPCTRKTPETKPDHTYDFIIIGGGIAGATLAGRLGMRGNLKTLLLEAGSYEPPATQMPLAPAFVNTAIDWNYTTQQETQACLKNDGICTWASGKVLGGTSVLNDMMYLRATRPDLQKWVDAGSENWDYDAMLPLFTKSEDNTQIGSLVSADYHVTGGPLTVSQFNYAPALAYDILTAANQTGFNVSNDLNGEQFTGFAIAQANNRNGTRLSTAKAFVHPQTTNPNFHIMLNSTVTKIFLRKSGNVKEAYAVKFIYNNETYIVHVKYEVILAAGAINTPQILLLSGIGDESVLKEVGIKQVHDLKGVGKGIKNHVSFSVHGEINQLNEVDLNFETLDQYIETQNGILSSTGLSQVTARLSTKYSTSDDPDLQLLFKGYNNTCAYAGGAGLPVDPNNPTAKRPISISAVNLHPKSNGSITLLTNNPLEPPKIVANYLHDSDDIKVIIAGIRIIQKLAEAPILVDKYNFTLTKSSYGECDTKYEYDSDEFWECAIRYDTNPESHQCCSCKMGLESDPETCVNYRLLVHGVYNLRIVDASVMPTAISASTQATLIAMADRLALWLKGKYPPEAQH